MSIYTFAGTQTVPDRGSGLGKRGLGVRRKAKVRPKRPQIPSANSNAHQGDHQPAHIQESDLRIMVDS